MIEKNASYCRAQIFPEIEPTKIKSSDVSNYKNLLLSFVLEDQYKKPFLNKQISTRKQTFLSKST